MATRISRHEPSIPMPLPMILQQDGSGEVPAPLIGLNLRLRRLRQFPFSSGGAEDEEEQGTQIGNENRSAEPTPSGMDCHPIGYKGRSSSGE